MGSRIPTRKIFYNHAHSAWLGAVLLFAFARFCSAEVHWSNDLNAAVDAARKSQKLVMVVDLPTYTKAGDSIAEANDAFLVGSVHSERMSRMLRYDCISVLRSVGVPRFEVQRKRSHANASSRPYELRQPVTYFCMPALSKSADPGNELQVVHFCVGYVGADRLAQAARWAIDTQSAVLSETVADAESDTGEFLGVAHADACREHDVSQVDATAKLKRNSNTEFDVESSSDVRKVLQSTLSFCVQELKKDLSRTLEQHLNGEEIDEHALYRLPLATKADPGHITLALLSNIRLSQLEQHCYEVLAHGQCYGTDTPRIRSLESELRKSAERNQGVLCRIVDLVDEGVNGELVLNDLLAGPMMERRLKNVEIVSMLEGELSAIQHLRRKRIGETAVTGNLRFAVFNLNRELVGTVYDSERMAKSLSRVLDKAVRGLDGAVTPSR